MEFRAPYAERQLLVAERLAEMGDDRVDHAIDAQVRAVDHERVACDDER